MKTSVKRLAAAAAVMGAVIVAALLAPRGGARRVDVAESGVAPGAAATPVEAGAVAPCQFAVGQSAAWRYTQKTTSMTETPGSIDVTRRRQVSDYEFSALLHVTPLSVAASGDAVLLARLSAVDVMARQTHGAQLEEAFLVRVSPRCQLTGFARGRSVPVATARAQQAAMHQLWFVVPDGETQTASGENGVGRFDAILASAEDQGRRTAQRRITAYSRSWASGPAPSVEDSFLGVTLGGTTWFESARGTERYGGVGPGAVQTTLSLEPSAVDAAALATASRSEADYLWENLLSRATASVAGRPVTFTAEERAQHAALRDVPFETALDMFASKLANNQNVNEQWPVMARYLEAHPETIPEYAEALKTEAFPSQVRGTAFLALGKARVPEAREALFAIAVDRHLLVLDRHRANLALVEREDVGIEVAQALRSEAKAIRSANEAERFMARNSALALGMLVGVRTRGSDVQDEASGMISDLLAGPQTAGDLRPAFGAMGNTGDVAYLPVLESYARHSDPEVRAAATKGFRRLKPEQTNEFVVSWLSRETSPEVKRELFHVIHHQHLDAREDVSETLARFAAAHLAEQPMVLTRQSLVRILGPLASKYPFAKAALLVQVKHEVHEDSGLYDLISQYVHGDEVSAALHELPEFQTEDRLVLSGGAVGPPPGVSVNAGANVPVTP